MMVAVSIFAIVMMIGVGALLALIQTNKRAQAINSVMNNVNAALESMSRSIRVGSNYHCALSSEDISNLTSPSDCSPTPGVLIAFEASDGDKNDPNDQVVYRLNGTQIERSLCSGVNQTCASGAKNGAWVAMTAPEVTIDPTLSRFYVIGSTAGDGTQPRILITLHGSAKVPGGTTEFTVQSSVVQRLLDL